MEMGAGPAPQGSQAPFPTARTWPSPQSAWASWGHFCSCLARTLSYCCLSPKTWGQEPMSCDNGLF